MGKKRTVIGKFIHSSWINLNIRCGKYRHLQTENKCKSYENIGIEFTRDEYKHWCYENKETIEKLNRPSLDRIDSTLNYSIENIRVIELSDNIRRKKAGSAYLNGPKSKILRGIRKTKSGKFSARVRKNTKELHIGTFNSEKEAYIAFHSKFLEINGYEPFKLEGIDGKT